MAQNKGGDSGRSWILPSVAAPVAFDFEVHGQLLKGLSRGETWPDLCFRNATLAVVSRAGSRIGEERK